jgi:hypothetical protein
MSFVTAAMIVGGATLASSYMGSRAAGKAADVQAGASDRAADLQYQQFREAAALQEPWRQAGQRALTKLEGAVDYTPFNYNAFTADPGYAFRLSEGQKALERSAAARGGLMSGATGKALTRYGQEMGSQEYTNAFNRYQTERAAKLQPLQSLAGVGQTTAQQIGQAGQNMASNVGEALMSGANARASGYVGGANALNQGLNTYLNYTQGQNMLNMLNQGNVMAGLQTPAGIASYFGG